MITNYRVLSDAINQLKKRGFTQEYKLKNGKLHCLQTGKNYNADDLQIIEYHRFEGESNPSDMSIVYAIECKDGSKGTVISPYGVYADMKLVAFLDMVKIKERTEAAGRIRKNKDY